MIQPESFFFKGSKKTAVLLIHGFTGTPSEMRPLGSYLHEKGYTVSAPLLAGHGKTPEALETTRKEDWIKSASDAYFELSRKYDRVFVGGLSMGGLIALHLAARLPVSGVVAMCAPIYTVDTRLRFVRFLYRIRPYQKTSGSREPHISEYVYSMGRMPLKSAAELWDLIKIMRREIKDVHAPALIMQSEQDKTVQPRSATYIAEKIRSKQKILKWYPNSGHILPVDHDREQVWADFVEFIELHSRKNG